MSFGRWPVATSMYHIFPGHLKLQVFSTIPVETWLLGNASIQRHHGNLWILYADVKYSQMLFSF